ncbi:unnamed protein product [Coregonus sp. 'balchen']|nr:unnamed protein product [Coregonus sp. 'balchen']
MVGRGTVRGSHWRGTETGMGGQRGTQGLQPKEEEEEELVEEEVVPFSPFIVPGGHCERVRWLVFINSKGLVYSVILLLGSVFLTVLSVHLNRWWLDRRLGLCLMMLYAIFLLCSVGLQRP